jgi:hypothetical protein
MRKMKIGKWNKRGRKTGENGTGENRNDEKKSKQKTPHNEC